MRADRGTVGLSGSPIYASLLVSDCCGVRKTSIDEAYGKKGVYLDLTASTKNNSTLNVDVKDVTSGDDVHIDTNDGFSTKRTVVHIAYLTDGTSLYGFITGYNETGFDFQDADTGEVTTIAWADLDGFGTTVRPANVPADNTFSVDNILAAGDVTIDATDSVTLNVEGAITSGLKDIEFTIGSGGDISGNLFDYTVAVTGTEVEIENLKHDGGNINIQTGSLIGDGTLRVLDGYAHVDLTNNSNLDLTLNDIDINDRINGQITVNSDTDVQSNEYDSIQVEKYGYETGMITVSNTGDADILLKGQLLNSSGTTSLSAASGSIRNASASHLIAAKDINLTATGGHIGGSYVKTDVGVGKIDADATHDIDLNEVDGDMRVGEITSTSGDVTLLADDSIVDADDDSESDVNGADINLTAQNGGIGSSTNHLDINSSNSGAGEVTATAESSAYVTETIGNMNVNQVTSNSGDVALKTSAGDINLGTINATSGDTELKASGSILDADNTAASNINSININLTAQPGSIGVSSNHLDIDLSGVLKALADQGVYITEVDGDMNLDQVTSNTSDVTLIADESMVDANDD